MLIGICGSICAGKHTVAEYLVQHHGFLRLHLPSQARNKDVGSAAAELSDDDDARRMLPSVTDEKGTRGLTFPDVDALLDFVMKRWREHWVLTDIYDEITLERLLMRPFFLLVSVDAPLGQRFQRFSNRCQKRDLQPWDLARFVTESDRAFYGHHERRSSMSPATAHFSSHAHIHLLNTFHSIPSFHASLSALDLTSPTRLRPTWDAYFMTLASLAAQRSNCMKRRVGCVLIANNRIIATGYNGTPRNLANCNEGGCARCNKGPGSGAGLSTCLCLHAEENALLEAGRERIKPGSVLYCNTCPCLTCSVKIVQVGISEVVFSQSYNMDEATAKVFQEAGVQLRQFSPPRTGLVDLPLMEEELGQAMILRNGTV